MGLKFLSAACALLLGSTAAASNLTAPQSSQKILHGDFQAPQVWENTNVVRTTNLEKGYVRETINVVVANIDSKPQSEYYVPFKYDTIGKVGGFEVRDKKDANKDKFEVTTTALAAALGAEGPSPK
jgi:oligosaccharyltransferase complex subunit alpha (ribophorin I)